MAGKDMAMPSLTQPKTYKIPSQDWGITAGEAASMLQKAQEIRDNKPLLNAALKKLRDEKKAINKIV